MNRDCQVIEELWLALNPHAQIHGCQIDDAGTVTIFILYSRESRQHPLELTLGNPAKTVIRGLRQAVNAQAREKRLTVSGSRIIEDTGGRKLRRDGL